MADPREWKKQERSMDIHNAYRLYSAACVSIFHIAMYPSTYIRRCMLVVDVSLRLPLEARVTANNGKFIALPHQPPTPRWPFPLRFSPLPKFKSCCRLYIPPTPPRLRDRSFLLIHQIPPLHG